MDPPHLHLASHQVCCLPGGIAGLLLEHGPRFGGSVKNSANCRCRPFRWRSDRMAAPEPPELGPGAGPGLGSMSPHGSRDSNRRAGEPAPSHGWTGGLLQGAQGPLPVAADSGKEGTGASSLRAPQRDRAAKSMRRRLQSARRGGGKRLPNRELVVGGRYLIQKMCTFHLGAGSRSHPSRRKRRTSGRVISAMEMDRKNGSHLCHSGQRRSTCPPAASNRFLMCP